MSSNQNKNPSPWATVPILSGVILPPMGWYPFISISPPSEDPVLPEEIKDDRDGCTCKSCEEFYQFALPNQEDNKTFICFKCRNGY